MSLQVDPAVLRQGAAELRTRRALLDDVMTGIRFEYTKLREVWTGRAAEHVTSAWEELTPRVTAHIAQLAVLASGLAATSDEFVAEDASSSDRIASAESSLDLP